MNQLQERIKSIEKQIAETTSEYTKGMLEERLACLTGGIGVIRVGAYTDTDFNAKKYKFENAINSTQAALQEGILPGGGIALMSVGFLKHLDPIFQKSLVMPFFQMSVNAGLHRKSFWQRLFYRAVNLKVNLKDNIGIDFKSKKRVNMFDAGIIDPYKVVRLALESAVSIASILITTEVAIIDEKEDAK